MATRLEEDAREAIRGGLIFGYFCPEQTGVDDVRKQLDKIREFWTF
jgi:hypothetical protein